MLQHRRALVGSGNPVWLPTIGGVAPTIYADFAANNYWYKGNRFGTETAWSSAISATFTRASTAYYTNSSGLLTSVGNNVLRFDYNPSTLASNGILLEGASTNILTFSNTFTNGAWSSLTGVTVASTSAVNSPDGTADAYTVIQTNANSQHVFNQNKGSLTQDQTWTSSLYVRQNGSRYFYIDMSDGLTGDCAAFFDLQTGSVLGTTAGGSWTATIGAIVAVGNGWYRTSLTATMGSTASNVIFKIGINNTNATSVQSFTGDGVSGFYIFGAQSEQLSFPSSYIPTAASTASRSADNLSFPTTGLSKSQTLLVAFFANTGVASGILLQQGVNLPGIRMAGTSIIGTIPGVTDVWADAVLTNGGLFKVAASFTPGAQVGAVNGSSTPSGSTAYVGAPSTFYIGQSSSNGNQIYTDLTKFGFWSGTVATSAQTKVLSMLP